MDILKQKPKKTLLNNKGLMVTIAVVIVIILVSYAKASLNNVSLARKDLLLATVKQGDIDVTVEGYGKLTSDKLQLITTLTKATVEEILLKPGATVTKESVIVKLANPELQQQVQSAEYSLAESRANLRQLKLNQRRETLTEKSSYLELVSQHKGARLTLTAQNKLVKSGIVKQIDYQESILREDQLKERIEIFNERNEQLKEVHKEAINIQLERIKQVEQRLTIAKDRKNKLVVKAGFDGVLQRLSVNLGQSLSAGQEVALIGSVTELIALIRVPQNQVQLVKIGQNVIVDTRQELIEGKVKRIDPIVDQNTVEVEISFPGKLPKSARPEQNIDAVITAKVLKNIYYIERPANVQAHSITSLYQLNEEMSEAKRVDISLGGKTGRFIEIRTGANLGDQFIISDLSNYKTAKISIL
ncbi:RND transporter [Colwellia sp. PAMC 20917]|uniref:efflux RND transporter periplasmic adaptor subunit n=1 Tax=Colwellia sp. PAMC 20917 TaxID=1816218 RepID=UPI000878945E|nr:HlyD family efflux transporter periplasmic adaptor subunit [Colwellia sp. PAMC 20917]AOW77175.1 RND transporter [Colwellia sp. PAMC 20917]